MLIGVAYGHAYLPKADCMLIESGTKHLKTGIPLSCIGPVLQLSGKKQLHGKYEEETDAGSGQHFDNKIKERTEFKPFQKCEIRMMKQCQ